MALSTNTPPVTVPESNIIPTCPFGTTPDANGNCIQGNIPVNTGNLSDLTMPESGTCQEQGKVECTNGSCADTLEECGSVYEDYSKDIGYDPEGKFITDKPETSYDDALHDVYLAINGPDGEQGWTGLSFEDWVVKYGDTFPQWKGSQYESQSELLEAQLGLLKPALELKMESFDFQKEQNRWQTTTALEDQTFSSEALWRSTGGLGSGPSQERVKTAYDRVLEGFDYGQEAIDMERENSLIDYESKVLTYEFDLSKVVSDFQDNMWDLITANKALQEGPEDGSTGPGCTDSEAMNYNPNASEDDGSCTYSEYFGGGCDAGQLDTGWTENSAGQCVSPEGDVTDATEWIASQFLYTESGEVCNCSSDSGGGSSCFGEDGNSCDPDWSYTDPTFCNPQLPSDHPAGCGGGEDPGITTPSDFSISDRRLKENIIKVGQSMSGIDIYEFDYKSREGRYRGVMANDIKDHYAVTTNKSGYYQVDYSKIDVNFERIA